MSPGSSESNLSALTSLRVPPFLSDGLTISVMALLLGSCFFEPPPPPPHALAVKAVTATTPISAWALRLRVTGCLIAGRASSSGLADISGCAGRGHLEGRRRAG